MEKITKVAIVEDNEVVLDGFTLLINSMSGYEVIGSYMNCEAALKDVPNNLPKVILMDLDLPGMSGIEGIKRLKKLYPEIMILVITVRENSQSVFDALCAGADGYITKNTDYGSLLEAINEVQAGGAPMSKHIAKMVVQSFQRNTNSPLTPRETEVLELLSKGKSYTVIADELFVHKETIKSHIKNIYYKLQVNSKAAAIEKAIQQKLI